MDPDIENFLTVYGPCLSSRVVESLKKKGLSHDAARQRVSRAKGRVQRLRGIQFPNREKFLFLRDQFGGSDFRQNLVSALIESRTSYGRALAALGLWNGAMPADYFPLASGLPVEKTKKQILASTVMERLLQLQLITVSDSADGRVVASWDCSGLNERRRAAMSVEHIVLGAVATWLAKLGFTSSGTVESRSLDTVPKFGLNFDVVGPCYLQAISSPGKDKPKPGFILGDILLDTRVTVRSLDGFLNKWAILAAQRRPTRFQPIFIAESFDPDALNLLRSKGCIIALKETIFGEKISALLQELAGTTANAAAAVTKDPDAVFNLVAKIAKLEGAAFNLRGIVLELMIAHVYKLQGYSIDVRRRIKTDGGSAEIDVKAHNTFEVVCVECKGKAPNGIVDAPEIQTWLDVTLPRIKNWLKLTNSLPDSRRFEFYSSTDYTDRAKELIEVTEAAHKKAPIKFLNGKDILEKLQQLRLPAIADMSRDQFVDGKLSEYGRVRTSSKSREQDSCALGVEENQW